MANAKVEVVEKIYPIDMNNKGEDITVGLNGKIYRIKRGVKVKVPKEVDLIIQNSMNQDNKTMMMLMELEENTSDQ
ncbi:MAG: hypothetical protein E7265_06645 [Lachnospiraceae bacterium]|nr:hypothetical protein [Lachnospiraceae bacterium]